MRFGIAVFGCLWLAAMPTAGVDTAGVHRVSLSMSEITSLAVDGDVRVTQERGVAHLRYTAIVGQDHQTIRAAITAGEVPPGTRLLVAARDFGLNEGTAAGELALGSSPAVLVDGIRSCATGGGGAGPELIYHWSIDDPQLLEGGSETHVVTVSFWLGDDRADHRVVLGPDGP